MANSKSNIYPIQLQGAELCLNRYDAEIKQYSGFNKNNSPFVGGCLSNVFTKEEQIEGGDDNTVYIDEKNNIFKVTENGLFKNGNQLIQFDENSTFFEQEKIKVTPETVRIFGKCDNGLVRVEKRFVDGKVNLVIPWKVKIHDEWYDHEYTVGIDVKDDDSIYDCMTAIFVESEFNVERIKSCIFVSCFDKLRVATIDIHPNAVYSDPPVIVHYEYDITDVNQYVSICYNDRAVSQMTNPQFLVFYGGKARIFLNQGYGISEYLNAREFTTISKIPNSLMYDQMNLYSYDIGTYHVSNYPLNSLTVLGNYRSDVVQHNNCVVFTLHNPYYNPLFDRIVCNTMLAGKLGSSNNIWGWGRNDCKQADNIRKGTISQYASAYDFQSQFLKSQDDTDNDSFLVHFAGRNCNTKGFLFYKDDEYSTIIRGKFTLGDFYQLDAVYNLAFNNNQFTAICGHYVLLTNWNSINPKTLSIDSINEELFYKEGDTWYCIKKGLPQIKRKLNQLVINIDDVNNSYDLKENKFLLFAPALNSVRSHDLFYSSHFNTFFYNDYYNSDGSDNPTEVVTSSTSLETPYYYGFAINEYKQEENSSIILNPFAYRMSFLAPIYPMARDVSVDRRAVYCNIPKVQVNIYSNVDSNRSPTNIIKYQYSVIRDERNMSYLNMNVFEDVDLLDLPFPIDTNGNIEYSPSLFSKISKFGNMGIISNGNKTYQLVKGNNNELIFSFYLGTEIDNLTSPFIIQGQYYGIIGNQIFSLQFNNGVVNDIGFVVDIANLQFVGNTPYEALFFSKTNRCLYSFTGANVLSQKQLVDKISEVKNYLYNPATQTVFLITDIGIIFYGLFGIFLLEYTNITKIFLLDNGIVLSDNLGNYRYIKYYLDEGDEGYTKENIRLETCFYGMNNETVTINDCLYFRLFSEEHEEGDLKVSATTISLSGRKTEETTFKIKASDWDKITHTIYMRYQPKTQRGLGVSFSIDSPFKIASLSVGSQPDAILVDKVSKGAINAPSVTSNNDEW